MTARVKLEIAGAVLALVVIGIIGGSWLGAREDRIKLAATLEAQKSVLADAGKREETREAALKESLAQLADLAKRTQTPAEVVKTLPQVLPLPQPIILQQPAMPPQGQASGAAPPTPQNAIVPAADLKPLFDFATECKACQAKVLSLTQDKADDQVKIGALTKERDTAVTASKGGTVLQRIKRGAKWFAIGALAGAAAAAAAHH